eukprot:3566999-Pyramimonas_sp.AAC.1
MLGGPCIGSRQASELLKDRRLRADRQGTKLVHRGASPISPKAGTSDALRQVRVVSTQRWFLTPWGSLKLKRSALSKRLDRSRMGRFWATGGVQP